MDVGEVLVRGPQLWSPADLAPLKAAGEPALRRRAWWLHRNRGGWEAVIADLELLHDADLRHWLVRDVLAALIA